MDPALRRDSNADVELPGIPLEFPTSLVNGLVDGVGLEVFGSSDCKPAMLRLLAPGENLEGTVPARTRRGGLCMLVSAGGMKSGNPS